MSSYVVAVFFSLIFGLALALWAKQQNRDPFRWFLAGTLLSIFGVALALMVWKRRKSHELA